MPEFPYMPPVFKCEHCGLVWRRSRSYEEIEAESKALFADSFDDESTQWALVCDNCFQEFMKNA